MPRKLRITIVNDYPEFLDLMAEFLGDEGYDVITFPKHQGAFVQIKETLPDLIICDLMFDSAPVGWALIDMLHLDPKTNKIPIIICTAATKQVQEVAPSLDAKGIRWLEKPFTLEQLINGVNEALQDQARDKGSDANG